MGVFLIGNDGPFKAAFPGLGVVFCFSSRGASFIVADFHVTFGHSLAALKSYSTLSPLTLEAAKATAPMDRRPVMRQVRKSAFIFI